MEGKYTLWTTKTSWRNVCWRTFELERGRISVCVGGLRGGWENGSSSGGCHSVNSTMSMKMCPRTRKYVYCPICNVPRPPRNGGGAIYLPHRGRTKQFCGIPRLFPKFSLYVGERRSYLPRYTALEIYGSWVLTSTVTDGVCSTRSADKSGSELPKIVDSANLRRS